MTHTTGTLDAAARKAAPLDATRDAGGDRPHDAMFTYATGNRPLDGYTIKRGVGHGGFGEVYYATSDGGKEVALKLIRRNYDIELRGVSQCLNLKHPNLLAVHDIRRDERGDHWVVMEFIGGESLEQAIARHPNGLPREQALLWFHGLAAGVAYLHDHGVVHRDLKPANLFLDEGVVKIGDYGLSKFISASRRSGQTGSIGTVHYMAPEIAGGRYGKEIDIYALGIILYEMLTGKVPFDGESVGEILMKHLTATPDVSALDEPYRAVVASALAKDVSQRPKSVAEMAAALPGATAAQRAEAAAAVNRQPPPPPQDAAKSSGCAARKWHFCPTSAEIERIWRGDRAEPGNLLYFAIVAAVLLFLSAQGFVRSPAGMSVGTFIFLIAAAAVLNKLWRRRSLNRTSQANNATPSERSEPVREGSASKPASQPHEPLASPASMAQPPYYPHGHKLYPRMAWPPRRGEAARQALILATPRERLTELTGSMLVAAVVAAATCVPLTLMRGQLMRIEQFAWLALVGTAAAWCLLAAGKLWEGNDGEPIVRRFILLFVGMAVGLFAWWLDAALLVGTTYDVELPSFGRNNWFTALYDHSGRPMAAVYLAYFGALFAVPAWWRQTDPLRGARVNLWSTAWVVLVAWLVNLVWTFPQPWGLMTAAVASLAVQLASPWQRMD